MEVVPQGFDIDWNPLPATIFLLGMVKNSLHSSLCNTQQLTQPPLALSVPLSRFTSRVGGGSAFVVRQHVRIYINHSQKLEADIPDRRGICRLRVFLRFCFEDCLALRRGLASSHYDGIRIFISDVATDGL